LSFRRLAVASALAFAVPLFAQPAFAQERQAAAARPSADRDPVVSITRHTGTFGGQRVSYTATAGETFLPAEDRPPRAATNRPSSNATAAPASIPTPG
jgi:hypothetical protein